MDDSSKAFEQAVDALEEKLAELGEDHDPRALGKALLSWGVSMLLDAGVDPNDMRDLTQRTIDRLAGNDESGPRTH